MKKIIFFTGLLLTILVSCDKMQLSDNKPIIQLKIAEAYVYSDTNIIAGRQFVIGITASSSGGENLTNLIVESNGARIVDKGFNVAEFSEDIPLTKSVNQIDTIKCIIRNKARKADTVTISISRLLSAYSPIIRYNTIILGAQDNTSLGNYFSFATGDVYTQSEAFNNQEFVDLIYYFDESGDLNTLASPGANLDGIITGTDSPEYWTTIRTTRYSREAISIADEEFSLASNDSLIVANLFADGGRKAKMLQNNQFYGIQSNEFKYGLIKIENVNGEVEGTIQISLIIQK